MTRACNLSEVNIGWWFCDSPCLFLKNDSEEMWDTFHWVLSGSLQQQTGSGLVTSVSISAGTDDKPNSSRNAIWGSYKYAHIIDYYIILDFE